jgi:LmbE family N-acetylglucosaminyl deacetylase
MTLLPLSASLWMCVGLGAPARTHAQGEPAPLLIAQAERLLVIAPHPDDETLGTAGLAQRVLAHRGTVRTVVVTAGDGYIEAVRQRTRKAQPAPWAFLRYGELRIREALSAAHVLSKRIRLGVLGFPDGMLAPLLAAHWDHVKPGRSATTHREAPPYAAARDRFSSYSGHDLRARLMQIMQETRPTLIAFTDPIDQHPDHRATGLFALLATSDYVRQSGAAWPRLMAYVIHWNMWPYELDGRMYPLYRVDRDRRRGFPADLPAREQARACLTLTDSELVAKQAALAEYRTQQSEMAPFLAGFVRRSECFSQNSELDASLAGRDIGHKSGRGLLPQAAR